MTDTEYTTSGSNEKDLQLEARLHSAPLHKEHSLAALIEARLKSNSKLYPHTLNFD